MRFFYVFTLLLLTTQWSDVISDDSVRTFLTFEILFIVTILKKQVEIFSLNAAWLAGKGWDQWTSAAPPVVLGTVRL